MQDSGSPLDYFTGTCGRAWCLSRLPLRAPAGGGCRTTALHGPAACDSFYFYSAHSYLNMIIAVFNYETMRSRQFPALTGPVVRRLLRLCMAVTALSLAACAGVPRHTVPEAAGGAPHPAAEPAAPSGPGMSEEVLYKLLVAEFAGQRGELEVSVKNYLDAARLTRDPQVAERAVRIAVYARDDAAALEAARLWADVAPESRDARQVLAALYIRDGRIDAAVKELDGLLSHWQGERARAFAFMAEMLARERDKDRALKVMQKLVEGHQGDLDAQRAYATLAVRAGDLALAETVLSGVLEKSPEDRGAALLYAQVLQSQGKTAEALKRMAALVKDNPKDGTTRLAYARLLVGAKRYDESLEQFRALAKQNPKNADVRYAMALLLLQTNRLDQAESEFKELLSLGQRALTARYYLGQLAEAKGDVAEAIGWYTGVDRGEHYVDAQVRVAVLLARQGKLDRARAHLHGVQARNSKESVHLYLVEGELLTDAEKYDEAMTVYNFALKEFPDESDLLYARAMLGERMGRLDVLERDLRAIISREPNNAQALNALGYTLADRTKRYAEAKGLIERALSLKPDDYYILDSMGWVLYRMGQPQEALKYLRRAAELSDDVEVAAHLGEVLWVSGDQKGARDVWDSALKSTPDDKRLLEVIKRFNP